MPHFKARPFLGPKNTPCPWGIRQHIMRFPRNRPNPPRRAGVGGQSRLPWGAEPPIASTSSQLVFTYSQLAFTYSGKRRAGRSSWTNAPMFNRQFRFIILDTRPTWPLNAMLGPTSNTRTLWRVTKCHQPGSSGSSDGQDVDIVFDPRIRQLHCPGWVSTPKAKKIALFNVHKKNSQCADVTFNVRRKAVSVRTLNI